METKTKAWMELIQPYYARNAQLHKSKILSYQVWAVVTHSVQIFRQVSIFNSLQAQITSESQKKTRGILILSNFLLIPLDKCFFCLISLDVIIHSNEWMKWVNSLNGDQMTTETYKKWQNTRQNRNLGKNLEKKWKNWDHKLPPVALQHLIIKYSTISYSTCVIVIAQPEI